MLTCQHNFDDVYGGNYDEPHSNTITINLIPIRYRVNPPPELRASGGGFVFSNTLHRKSLLFRGGRTNQIPLTIKPYPMKSQR
jgi:hypothetical protein